MGGWGKGGGRGRGGVRRGGDEEERVFFLKGCCLLQAFTFFLYMRGRVTERDFFLSR